MESFCEIFSAACKDCNQVAVFALFREAPDIDLNCYELVPLIQFAELIQNKALDSFVDHSMACKEEQAKVLDVRLILEHFTEGLHQLGIVFESYVITLKIFVQNKVIGF